MSTHLDALGTILALVLVVAVLVGAIVVGSLGTRVARTTDDFLAASRTVRVRQNAAAISGQTLSAASFLGVAGLVLTDGVDALWYSIGFVGGFLALLLFVAAPLRRSGAYTVPDFAEARLDSARLRTVTTVFVLVIGWFFLLPQLQASGLALEVITGAPYWVGVLVVGVLVTAAVTFGGMRSMTFVQVIGFWLKLAALAVPALALLLVVLGRPGPTPTAGPNPPAFTAPTGVSISTPATLRTAAPVDVTVVGTVDGAGGPDARRVVHWAAGSAHRVAAGTQLRFEAGEPVPAVTDEPQDDGDWVRPFPGGGTDVLGTYSLMVAAFLGIMGLPHVLVRYYTNPDGRAARRTTVWVLVMLGGFSVVPAILGALSRFFVPQLLVTGQTDAAVLLLPSVTIGGVGGSVLGALVAAGAFAAFLAVSSGLVLTVAGALSSDVLPGRFGDFRIAAHVAGVVPIVLALVVTRLDLAQTVALALVVSASTFCPLLVLGIWWRGLTDRGAMAGMLAGGGLATAAVAASLAGVRLDGPAGTLLAQPALITVPVAFLVMVTVSRATAQRVPSDVGRILLRLHAPERLGLGDQARGGRPAS